MKTAQELRVGNVVMINNTPMVILKSEYSKGGRGASTVKLKMKNLLSNGGTETVYRADDRFEDIILDKKEVSYSYFGDPLYVWMDDEYNQYEVEAEVMEDVLKYLEDGMKLFSTTAVLSPSNSRQSWFVKLFTPNLQLRVILPAKS